MARIIIRKIIRKVIIRKIICKLFVRDVTCASEFDNAVESIQKECHGSWLDKLEIYFKPKNT